MPASCAARLCVAKERSASLGTLGLQQKASNAQRCDVKRMRYPTTKVLAMKTRPEGVLSRVELGEEKPKFLIRLAEYVVTTPQEIEV